MKNKLLKILIEFLVCVLILLAAAALVYFGYHYLFGDLGEIMKGFINQFI